MGEFPIAELGNLRLPRTASMLRLNLFTYRHLRDWLDDPFNTPPIQPIPKQLELALL